MAQSTGLEDQCRALLAQIADKEGERERVLTVYRRGRATLDETEQQMDAIARETATLREMVESIRSQTALAEAAEAHLADAVAMLAALREDLDEIDRTNDVARKRRIVELLVPRITVYTEDHGRGKRKGARVHVVYAFDAPKQHVVSTTARRTPPAAPRGPWPAAYRTRAGPPAPPPP